MKELFEKIYKGLIVSCQAEGDSLFNSPDGVAAFAHAAKRGGAVAIRSEGVEKTKKITQVVDLPVIGLVKSTFPDGSVRITGRLDDVRDLIDSGCQVVAVDGTSRVREHMTGPQFIRAVKQQHVVGVMADISTKEEAENCVKAGADCLSTTLSGYTPHTIGHGNGGPDMDLLLDLVQLYGRQVPVIAEGRLNTPDLARKAIEAGAWAVVVGTAITRPHIITQWFVEAMGENPDPSR